MSNERSKGRLRLYLGAAPGVGKTYAMLTEGLRRSSRGTDVLVGLVETHDRAPVELLLRELRSVPPRLAAGSDFPQLDVDAVIQRRPDVVLVDDIARSNTSDARHPCRWQDCQELLDAGIDVVSTVNIGHLESLHDVVESITGVAE
ncbi:MAG: kdpD, partial [Nocardioidaceae bacterium]|nr:kdpD [Nocardioidaceae bacterium]